MTTTAAPAIADRVRTAPWTGGGLVVLMVALVVSQRFLVPPGSFPVALALPLMYLGVGLLLTAGQLRVDRARLELFAVAAALVLVATAAAGVTGGLVSVTSIGLLLALWAPWVVRVAPGHLHVHRRVARAFVTTMVVLASVGAAQMALQFAGVWEFQDYLAVWAPNLLADGFNASDPIFFGSPVWKSNAFVFLEPSFFSQFCALAVIAALVLREAPWKLFVLAVGLASSVSGTGILLLLIGVVVVVVRAPRLLQPGTFVAAGGAVAAVVLSPVFPLIMGRVDEPAQQGSSGYLRFVQPYTEAVAGLEQSPVRYLVGAGAGSAQRLLESGRGDTVGQAVLYSIIPKAVFEYGAIAGGVFILFIVLAVLDRGPWPVVPFAVLVLLLFLGGNLLQPQTVAVAWLLTSLFTDQHGPHAAPLLSPPRARRPRRAPVPTGHRGPRPPGGHDDRP